MYADKEKRLGIMSIGFLLQSRDDAVVWRGPKKNGEQPCSWSVLCAVWCFRATVQEGSPTRVQSTGGFPPQHSHLPSHTTNFRGNGSIVIYLSR